jgi:hypothetical protein
MLSTEVSTSRIHRYGTPPLWHYTCDHGRAALGDLGTLVMLP